MSQDNVLRKEFSKKDVQRVRNLVQGKTGDRTTEGIGYTKKFTKNVMIVFYILFLI